MLNIKTIKNSLISDESKDGFCFRSSCSQNLSQKKLAAEMADRNSSFTEADYLGMLSVMEKIVVKYLSKGYNVELPFGRSAPTPQELAPIFKTDLCLEMETILRGFCLPQALPLFQR